MEEKPLWVFVGATVSSGKLNKAEQLVATDVVLIIKFIAGFLASQQEAVRRVEEILTDHLLKGSKKLETQL